MLPTNGIGPEVVVKRESLVVQRRNYIDYLPFWRRGSEVRSGGNKRDNTVAGNRKDLRYWQIKFRRCRAHSFQPLPWAQKDLRGQCRYFALACRSLPTSARRSGSQTLEVAETRQGGDLRTALPNRGARLPAEFRFWVAQTKRNRHTASLGTLSRNTASG